MTSDSTRTGMLGAAGGGAVAFLLGYVLTYATSGGAVRESGLAQIAEAFGGDGVAWKMVGWVFFNAHFVSTTIDVDVPLFGGTEVVNLIAQSDAISAVLYVVPPALLVVAGLVGARVAGAASLGDAVRIGPAVTLGYLPLAVVGAVLFTLTVGDSVGKPTLVTAVGLAGVVYPVVFGTLGATLGVVTAESTPPSG